VSAIVFTAGLVLTLAPTPLTAQALPFPQHVRYAAGTLLPNHVSQAALDADVRDAWAAWKTRYLASAGTEGDGHPRFRVKSSTSASAETVSEGQGYGMLLAVSMAGSDAQARQIFDGLWEFALDHPSEIDGRLMDWHVPANESLDPEGNDAAFDGDADLAYALLMAERQWGGGGRFAYGSEAARVLAGIGASMLGPSSHYPLLGDWVDPGGTGFNQWTTRTSDFMPGHFLAFYHATGDEDWRDAAAAVSAATETLQTTWAPSTGLLPDFVEPTSTVNTTPRPADPNFLEGPEDGAYWYNAGRDPWRLATAALVWNDGASRTQARRLATFARTSTAGQPFSIKLGYQLNGTPIIDAFSSFYAAPFGVAAQVDPSGQAFLNDIWQTVESRTEGYFEDSVTLLSMLVMSGNFWDPVLLFQDGFEQGNTARWSTSSGVAER
jgi:endo-1,4-beta-D-glucanase Y